MYRVKLPESVNEQVAALPPTALAGFAEALVTLELAPWGGDPYDDDFPNGNIRTLAFGPNREGLLMYFIVEHALEVGIIELLWIS